ncbi:MAG: hypothetical protein LQ340_001846 [Diploschistes diacapsis]|nr:MAG: hypothetical protein LQ340_001846 [Diploschistes diacapsis]
MSQNKFAKLHNARVVVIGGTSGIGFAVAEGSVEFGASVVIAGSNQERLDNALDRLRKAYPDAASRISGKTCDISDAKTMEENLHALFKFATQDSKKVDHIVNTSGGLGPRVALADAHATDVLEPGTLRYVGSMMIGKIAPAYMEAGPRSSITFTIGTLSQKPMKGMSSSVGIGGAVEGLTRALAVDLAPLRVNIVSPGAIRTELLLKMVAGNEEFLQSFAKGTLLNFVAEPEDTAEAYLYLMRDRFMTGQRIDTDGGRMLV